MRFIRLALAMTVCLSVFIMTTPAQQPPAGGGGQGRGGAPPIPMRLTTTAFPDGAQIPAKFTQAGEQLSPQLAWVNAPAATVSFVLHMHDMEGVRNRTTDDQLHWLVWNIPSSTTSLPEGVPMGADLKDGSHQVSASGLVYRGPGAPATGPMHHYVFEIFALDTKIDVPVPTNLPDGAFDTRTAVLKQMQGHVLGKAVYLGLFHRPG
jgi:Raf kinase inhibitor-like YbhB/YbcL family protein